MRTDKKTERRIIGGGVEGREARKKRRTTTAQLLIKVAWQKIHARDPERKRPLRAID